MSSVPLSLNANRFSVVMSLSRIYLAPMEGVCDPPMRKVLTRHGAYDECFSEFIRVTTELHPHKTFLREVPELSNDNKTESGCPCRVQLLGDMPGSMAENAKRAAELGAKAIDINFGCPSRFVHHGGSLLLKEPDLLHAIVSTVREALDSSVHLSVKMRTGVLDHAELPTIVKAVAVDGLNELTIHARTRKGMYKKEELDWSVIANILDITNEKHIPVVANGDIVDVATSKACEEISKTDRQMIGRAAFGILNMPQVLRGEAEPLPLSKTLEINWELAQELQAREYPEKNAMDRLKQFLGYAHKYTQGLDEFFKVFVRAQSLNEAQQLLDAKINELEANS